MITDNIKSIIVESATGHCPLKFDDAVVLTINHARPKSISIDEIREGLIDTIGTRPVGCTHKVYLIPDAQLMTPSAQNALLKTLEEPPEYARIVLITDNSQSLLETVRSRCVRISDRGEPAGADEADAAANRKYFAEIFDGDRDTDSVRAAEIAREIIARGPDGPGEFIDAIREFLLSRAGSRPGPSDIRKGRPVRAEEALCKAEQRLKFNVNAELTLEMMLMEI